MNLLWPGTAVNDKQPLKPRACSLGSRCIMFASRHTCNAGQARASHGALLVQRSIQSGVQGGDDVVAEVASQARDAVISPFCTWKDMTRMRPLYPTSQDFKAADRCCHKCLFE